MNFFKKIFGTSKQPVPAPSKDTLLEQLKTTVEPFLTEATKIKVQKATRPPEDSHLKSHFGGNPYFEEGQAWPVSNNGKSLTFVFQIFNTPELCLPQNIKLVQFFYDYKEMPWSTVDDGWHIKLHESLNPDKVVQLDKPYSKKDKYCDIELESVQSMPNWEGIASYSLKVIDICEKINEEEPWEPYDQLAQALTGQEEEAESQLGGHPKWIQAESIPKDSKGKDLKFLFQIDSEENAGIMWGDTGMVYAFYDPQTKKIEFELQCY